jgi:cholesterol oxidase
MSLPEHFDAVIVGSGFGGSVMAYRLAEAGLRVCVLERGKAYPPNSFPRAPYDLARNFWDPSEGLYGMFNLWSFKGSGAVVASGLGGGSLIYANILIRKDERWFEENAGGERKPWPVTRAELDPHYDRVESMMNAQKYPLAHDPYCNTPKTRAMQHAATRLNRDRAPGIEWLPLNLAVSFRSRPVRHPDDDAADNPPIPGAPIAEARPNYHAFAQKRPMPRSTCRLCGECDLGCNYGSKNTLDYTYLTAAIHQPKPADVRTLCEVKRIEARDGARGYTVSYLRHDPDRPRKPGGGSDELTLVTCDRLILAAGTFGTPFLLMTNRARLPRLSSALGSRYCVNGDLLSFIVRATEQREGAAVPRRLDPSYGPVITSAIRFGDTLDGHGDVGRGFYVEDGGHPYLMSWFVELSGVLGYLRRGLHFLRLMAGYRLGWSADADLGLEISELIGDGATSASSMPVLSMGRDIPSARLFLRDGRLDCDWRLKESAAYYDRVRRSVRAIAEALGARYMDNPSFAWNFQQVLTAHPLGGCAMADRVDEGVVDARGQVFGCPDLYIADGSVLPGPVGPNPSLTIAALADAFADGIAGAASSGGGT